jgi:rhamnose utilization protein RhaD (predicted bifunctional aldolase and dehydrogenase)
MNHLTKKEILESDEKTKEINVMRDFIATPSHAFVPHTHVDH